MISFDLGSLLVHFLERGKNVVFSRLADDVKGAMRMAIFSRDPCTTVAIRKYNDDGDDDDDDGDDNGGKDDDDDDYSIL